MTQFFPRLFAAVLFMQLLGCNSSGSRDGEEPPNKQVQPTDTVADDSPGERVRWAEAYSRAVPMSELMDDMTEKMAANMPRDQAEQFKLVMKRSFDVAEIEKAARESLVKHFTAGELRALTQFYGSPEGKSVMKKFGDYMADVMPTIQRQLMVAAQKAKAGPAQK